MIITLAEMLQDAWARALLLAFWAGKRGRGRPPEDNRNIINGILWRLRTGAPWRDVPEKYGKWNSIYRRFRRWSACGVWESMAVALAETIDSTTVRAHVSAAGGKGGFIFKTMVRSVVVASRCLAGRRFWRFHTSPRHACVM
jgi:transposase